jgi:cell division protein FtsW
MLAVKKGDAIRNFSNGLAPFFLVIGLLTLLAALEPDVSVGLTLLLIMAVILFTAGARIKHFVLVGLACLPVATIWVVAKHSYVLSRFDGLLQPGISLADLKPQLRQALIAVGSGGLFGQGYGQGMQQLGFVPLGYNDFIGSVIGEEWGFAGMLFIILGFSAYGYLGFSIASSARTRFQQLMAVGITFTVLFTAFVHMGVVTGALPTTGLTLPFVSYGRSNLLLSLVMTGILVNIGSARERVYVEEGLERRVPVASSA